MKKGIARDMMRTIRKHCDDKKLKGAKRVLMIQEFKRLASLKGVVF